MKNRTKLFGIIALAIVTFFFMVACDLFGEDETPNRRFTLIIINSSIYPITAFGVHTDARVGADSDGYHSIGFVRNHLWFDDRNPISILPEVRIEPGANSNVLGPFRVLFRSDRANPSIIRVEINYFDGNTIRSVVWQDNPSSTGGHHGFWESDVPNNFSLVFDGATLRR